MSPIEDKEIQLIKDRAKALEETLKVETDRGIAIVSCAYYETILEEMLRERFNIEIKKSKSFLAAIFDSSGPLSNFSSKIKLCFALDLISETTYKNLNTLRELRNYYAHNMTKDTIAEGGAGNIAKKLIPPKSLLEKNEEMDFENESNLEKRKLKKLIQQKKKYVTIIAYLGGMLDASLVVLKSVKYSEHNDCQQILSVLTKFGDNK